MDPSLGPAPQVGLSEPVAGEESSGASPRLRSARSSYRVRTGGLWIGVAVRFILKRRLEAEDVLLAAAAVAFDAGLAAVTLESVAKWGGSSLAAVQHIEPNEARLVAQVFTQIARAEFADTTRLVLACSSPVEQLRVLLQRISEPGDGELDSVWIDAWTLGVRNGLLGAAVREQEAMWHRLLEGVLRRGVKSGEFRPVDTDLLADRLLAISVAVNAHSLLGYGTDASRSRLLTATVRSELGIQIDEVPV